MIQKSFILSCLFVSLAFGAAPSAPSVSVPQSTTSSDSNFGSSKSKGLGTHSFLVGAQYGFEMSNMSNIGRTSKVSHHKVGVVTGYQYTNYGLFEVQVGLNYLANTHSGYVYDTSYNRYSVDLNYNGFALDVNLYGGAHFPIGNFGIAIKTGIGYSFSTSIFSHSSLINATTSEPKILEHLFSWKIGVDFNYKKITAGLYLGIPMIYSLQEGTSSTTMINGTLSYYLDGVANGRYSGIDWLRFTLNLQVGYRF